MERALGLSRLCGGQPEGWFDSLPIAATDMFG